MDLSFPAARNILAVCEYHYRLGVLHAVSAGDAELVRSIADRDDGYTTFQYLDGEVCNPVKKRQLYIHIDGLIALCRKIYCDSLAGYLRIEKSDSKRREICTIVDFHYRKGLLAGLRLRDKKKAKEFFDSFNRGGAHPHLFDKQKWDTMEYFDTVKHRINTIHLARMEAGKSSSMNVLSRELGRHIAAENERRRG